MADDVVTPSNPPVTPIKKEEFKEILLDVNVSQSFDEEQFKRVVHIRVDRLAWVR